MRAPAPTVSVVVPVYRSERSLELLVSRLLAVFSGLSVTPEIVLVDDASPDGSWDVLMRLKQQHGPALKIARLMRNEGQHRAVLCGLTLCSGDPVVIMDDDLQNPPEEIPKLLDAVGRGFDLVIAAYDTKKHSTVRNAGGVLVDWLIRRIFSLPAGFQLTSFRAARRAVVGSVLQMGGTFPYITCMLFSHASTYTNVPVRHDARPIGSSNYNFRNSFVLAANLILSYSPYLLYLAAGLCALAFVSTVAVGLLTLYLVVVHGIGVPGWASTIVSLSFFSGLILLSQLIMGVYILRLNQQLSRRVSYTIRELHE